MVESRMYHDWLCNTAWEEAVVERRDGRRRRGHCMIIAPKSVCSFNLAGGHFRCECTSCGGDDALFGPWHRCLAFASNVGWLCWGEVRWRGS